MDLSLGQMRRMSQQMSFGHNPKFEEGEKVRCNDNKIERVAIVKSSSWHSSEGTYYYWVKLESNDIDRMRLKKQSELSRL